MSEQQPRFTHLLNLASHKLGAKAIECSDDFFAPMENLVKEGRGIFIEDKYTERGKWMDGWESRRKRTEGHDWCIVKLGAPGVIHGVDVDTNHFTGNHPPFCSIDACFSPSDEIHETAWHEILPKSPLNPGSQHFFDIGNVNEWSHVKLHIYPDGGVARLKVYGEVKKDWKHINEDELIDLAAAVNGAKSVTCNDMYFSHMDNLLMPGRGINMGDGWETKRNRTPNNRDWVIVRLAHPGIIEKINVDTCHFKGNYPDTCLIEGCYSFTDDPEDMEWHTILDKVKLNADCDHFFENNLENKLPVSHVRLSIFPDGGISRLRLWGKLSQKP